MAKLRHRDRIGYGIGELGPTSAEVLIRVSLLIFYTDFVGLRPDLAGLAVALGVLWDAVTDPLMGRISDRSKLSGGRRRPFILAGAIWLALSLVVLFFPPSLVSQWQMFCYLVLGYMLVNTGITIVSIPHAALAGDMTEVTQERTVLFAWRLLFANLGLVLGTAIPGITLAVMGGGESILERQFADQVTAQVIGILAVVACVITFFSTRGKDLVNPQGLSQATSNFFSELRQAWDNHPFRVLVAGYLVANLGLSMNATFALYYYRYRLLLPEAEVRFIIAFFMLVFCLAIVGWVLAGRFFEKKHLIFVGISGLGLMSCVLYPLFSPGSLFGPLMAGLLGGLLVGSVVLLEAMVAETVDLDRVKTGSQKMGLYFGIWKLSSKISRALAVATAGFALSAIGFKANELQSPETSFWLAILFGPGVGSFFILGAVIVLFYPLTRDKLRQVDRILRKKSLINRVS